MGIKPKHRNGTHGTAVRCRCLAQGNVLVTVEDGAVVRAACGACGNDQWVVLVEGRNDFWPVPAANVIM